MKLTVIYISLLSTVIHTIHGCNLTLKIKILCNTFRKGMRELHSLNSSATLHFDLNKFLFAPVLEMSHLEKKKKKVPHIVFPTAHNSPFILSS